MRRGRIFGGLVVLVATLGVGFAAAAATATAAATPMDICRDLADGQLNGSYSQAELAAYQDALAHDPTIQGYCSPLVVVTVPPQTTTVSQSTTVEHTTTAQQPTVCAEGTTAQQGPNGETVCVATVTTTTPAGSTTVVTTTTPAQTLPPPPTTTSGVAGASKTKQGAPKPRTAGVAPASATKTSSPLATTRSSGTLPFTGAQLTLFVLVGLALLAAGFVLRRSTREKRPRP